MTVNEERVRDLAVRVAEYVAGQRQGATPRPRLIVPEHARPPALLDPPTRELYQRRIYFLASRYGLRWVIDQACLQCGAVEELSDEGLLELHRDIERAREAIAEGVSFDDIGLVRSA